MIDLKQHGLNVLDNVCDHLLASVRTPDGEDLDVQKAVSRLVLMSLNFDWTTRNGHGIYLMRPNFAAELMVQTWASQMEWHGESR